MTSGIRRLTPADIPACLALAVDRGWPAEEERWRLMLDLGEGYGWTGDDGELCATVVLTRYGGAGVVGMMLVAARCERRGIGRALMEHLLHQARDLDTVFLYSTPQGRPLYEQLGFAPTHEVVTHIGQFSPDPATAGPRTFAPVAADQAALRALDADVLGCDRSRLLERLASFAERIRVTRDDRGRVNGYAAAWRNAGRTALGPVIAPDLTSAQALVADLVTDFSGGPQRPVRLDCSPDLHPRLQAWALRRGLLEGDRTTFMVRGCALTPHPYGPYAPLMHGLG